MLKNRRDKSAENMFIGLDLAHESVSRGLRDYQLRSMAERLVAPMPGVNVRKRDRVPKPVIKRANEIYDPAERNVEAMFQAYENHLNGSDALDAETCTELHARLSKYAPKMVARMERLDLRFLGICYSSWVMDHFRLKDNSAKGRFDPEFQRRYEKRTADLEASITAFRQVHGDTVKVQDLVYRMNLARGLEPLRSSCYRRS